MRAGGPRGTLAQADLEAVFREKPAMALLDYQAAKRAHKAQLSSTKASA